MTQDEFDQWKGNPITEAFFSRIENARKTIEEEWRSQLFRELDDTQVFNKRIELRERLVVLKEIADITLEDISEDGEHERPGAD